VNVAVVPEYETEPPTGLSRESLSVNVEVVMVEAAMASVKVAVIGAFTATPVAPSGGDTDETVGATPISQPTCTGVLLLVVVPSPN
jgi:hypothetical protein